jgi:hypothetical protein
MFMPIHRVRPTCLWCHRRPALTCIRGSWRVVKDHDVCRQCWRGFTDARRAVRLSTAYQRGMPDGRNGCQVSDRYGLADTFRYVADVRAA